MQKPTLIYTYITSHPHHLGDEIQWGLYTTITVNVYCCFVFDWVKSLRDFELQRTKRQINAFSNMSFSPNVCIALTRLRQHYTIVLEERCKGNIFQPINQIIRIKSTRILFFVCIVISLHAISLPNYRKRCFFAAQTAVNSDWRNVCVSSKKKKRREVHLNLPPLF